MPADSGDSDDYTPNEEADLVAALESGGGVSATDTALEVTAQIEWNGVKDRHNNGVRRTKITGLRLGKVAAALAQSKEPASTYSRKTPGAQVRHLQSSAGGRAALAALGVAPKTIKGWAAGGGIRKSNAERLAAAYREQGVRARGATPAGRAKQNAAVADALTEAIADATGGDVRFRDITRIRTY